MKLIITLITLLACLNAFALSNNECRHGIRLCGYKVKNKKLFCKHMSGAEKACVESEGVKYAAFEKSRKDFKDGLKATKNNLDCSEFSAGTNTRRMCELIKELAKRL